MKLLLDENLSDRIISRIVDLFPGSTHIKAVGLREADDFYRKKKSSHGGHGVHGVIDGYSALF